MGRTPHVPVENKNKNQSGSESVTEVARLMKVVRKHVETASRARERPPPVTRDRAQYYRDRAARLRVELLEQLLGPGMQCPTCSRRPKKTNAWVVLNEDDIREVRSRAKLNTELAARLLEAVKVVGGGRKVAVCRSCNVGRLRSLRGLRGPWAHRR